MISRSVSVTLVALVALSVCSGPALQAANSAPPFPDSLVLKDGTTVNGIILKNSWNSILLQEQTEEKTYPKSEIVRIRDEADTGMYFTEVNRRGELPPWRVIANDLRTNDAVKELVEIPATRITWGRFKNIPYKSFRVNNNIELNIYGDPENPAAIEFGIFGLRSGVDKLRKILRAYLAGFLSSHEEIAALYALDFKGSTREVDGLVFEITPKNAPDAQGAWWISLSNGKKLARAQVNDAEYALVTRPEEEVVDKYGRLLSKTLKDTQRSMTDTIKALSTSSGETIRGFYRNKDGSLRFITKPQEETVRKLTN